MLHEHQKCPKQNFVQFAPQRLSNLHPNTILKPNLDSNTHPQPSAYSHPYT